MAHPLDGALLKLERANEHLGVLDDEIGAWLEAEPKPYAMTPRHWVDGTHHRNWVLIKVLDQPPPRFGVIVGDCVHCCRSALDYIVYELDRSLPRRARNRGKTQFPIVRENAAKYRREGLPLVASLPGWQRTVVRKLQPYQRRHEQAIAAHPLAILNSLSNRDKHRLVPVTIAQINEHSARIYGPGIVAVYDHRSYTGPLKDEAELHYLDYEATSDAHPEVTVEGDIVIDVALPNGLGVRQTLLEIILFVGAIGEWFAAAL